MESLKCEHVFSDGQKCPHTANWVFKSEIKPLCADCLMKYYRERIYEAVLIDDTIKEDFRRISDTKAKTLMLFSEISNFSTDRVGKTLNMLSEREKKMIEIMKNLDSNEKLTELKSLSEISLRLNNKSEVFKAIEYLLSEDDGVVYKDLFKDILEKIYQVSIQGNDQISKISEEIVKNRQNSDEKMAILEKRLEELEEDREQMKNEIKSLKTAFHDNENENLKEEIQSIKSNFSMQISSLKGNSFNKSDITTLENVEELISSKDSIAFQNEKQEQMFENINKEITSIKFNLENFERINKEITTIKFYLEKHNQRLETFIPQLESLDKKIELQRDYNDTSRRKLVHSEIGGSDKKVEIYDKLKYILFVNDIKLIFETENEWMRKMVTDAIIMFRKNYESRCYGSILGVKISEDDKVFICKI